MPKPKAHAGPGGSLIVDQHINGLTQYLYGDSAEFYTGAHMIGETITIEAMRTICKALNIDFQERESDATPNRPA